MDLPSFFSVALNFISRMQRTHNGNLGDIFLRNGIKLIELFYKRFYETLLAPARHHPWGMLDHSIYSYY